eukprot:1188130-Prorocentrum_minimum.AAC.3
MQEQHQIVETEHLMLVMMEQRDGLSKRVLDRVREHVNRHPPVLERCRSECHIIKRLCSREYVSP